MELRKIQVHPLFYIFMVIMILTGYFKNFIYFMILIFIHEIGHILMSQYFHWNIEKILILPFGGLTVFHEAINRPLKEELFITLSGPLMQVIGYFILKNWILDPTFSYYHFFILFFNLLPIIPLDGSKLVQVLGNYFYSFYYNQYFILFLSFILLCCLLGICIFLPFNFMLYLCIFFLFWEWYKEYKRKSFVFYKFLLERYQIYFPFKKCKTITSYNTKEMRRDYRHVFYVGKKSYTERDFLKRMFDFQDKI